MMGNKIESVFTEDIVLTKTIVAKVKYDKIEEHPLYEKLLKEFHPTKNGDLKLSDFSHGMHTKVWWLCPVAKDHEYDSTIKNKFIREDGCSCCRGLKVVLSNCFATTHPKEATQWHPTKNGNLTPYMVTAGSNIKVWWHCTDTDATDHEWEAYIYDRTRRNGCTCCSGHKIVLSNCLHTTHFELSQQLHPTKNGDFNAFNVGAGSNKKMHWICDKGHEWKAQICNRTSGRGCKICNESKGEKAVATFLDKHLTIYKRQERYDECKDIKTLPFDFYLPDYNILIEYDGIQHSETREYFGGKEGFKIVQLHDTIKTKFAEDNNIPLLRIPYTEFKNIEKILTSLFGVLNILSILSVKM